LQLSSGAPAEFVDLRVQLSASKNATESAVCVPSSPLASEKFTGNFADGDLQKWWDSYSHNIFCGLDVPVSGHLFLVLEKLDTVQYANCFYKGREKQTKLNLVAKIVNDFLNVGIAAGFRLQEEGNFDFTQSKYEPNSNKIWTIFMKTEKIGLIPFKSWKQRIAYIWQ
jgi:hypothetical protein